MLKRMVLLLAALAATAGGGAAHAQQRQITGTVTGNNGAPLASANVTVAGTTRGVQTNQRGVFTISVPAGDVQLRAAQIGYIGRTITVPAGQTTASFQLAQDILNIEGVVVTGQATTVRRANAANDVAVVTAQELQRVPAQTLSNALQGKVAGATISSNSGAPGGGMQIRLRGISSLSGSSTPLYVVDGVIVSDVGIPGGQSAITQASPGSNQSVQDNVVNRIADLNPADIQNVEILKGASASAIYGSRASNGVIVITTKRGRAGAPRYSLSQRFGRAELSNTLGSRQFTRATALQAKLVDSTTMNEFFNADGSPKFDIDQERALFGRKAPQLETTLSVSGGSENTQYFVSGLYMDNQGIVANTGYVKQGVKVSVDQTISRRARFGVTTNIIHSVASRGVTGNDNEGTSYISALSSTPHFINLRRGADGVFPGNPYAGSNPFEISTLSTNDEDTWRAIGALNLSVDLVKSSVHDLRFIGLGGADYFEQRNELYFPPELHYAPANGLRGIGVLGGGRNLNLNTNFNLVHTFSPRSGLFRATTSTGVQYEDRDLKTSQLTGRNLIGSIRLPQSAAVTENLGARERVKVFGVYGQEELLMFDERLLLTGSLRADRSSNNSDVEKYYYYPKAAASYRFPGFAFVDEVKLRGAYGASGNEPLYEQKYTNLTNTNVEGLPGLRVQGLTGASDLRPERTTELEGGTDITLFGQRARLGLTAYDKTVTDFLLSRGVAPSTGFATQFFNGGKLRVRGFEASLEGTPVRRGSFDWFTRTTFSRNRAKLLELPVAPFRPGNSSFGFSFGGYRITEGYSPTGIWSIQGLNQAGLDRKAAGQTYSGAAFDSVAFIGDAEPDFQMGFSNDFTVGPVTISSLFDWNHGGLVVNLTRNYYDFAGNAPDQGDPNAPLREYSECGTQCTGYERDRLHSGSRSLNPNGRMPVYVEDGGYVKLREVALSFDIPSQYFQRVSGRVDRVQLQVSGRNLKTWTNYSGLDPEVSNFGNRSVGRNMDVTPFPPSRTYWVGLNVGF